VRLGDADSGSVNFATGVVTITLSNSKAENVGVGGSLSAVNARTYLAKPDAGPRSQNISSDFSPDGNYVIQGNGACCGPVPLLGVASRKTHGSSGTFDVPLPLTGNPGIECRSGGPNGNYTIVFTFANPVTGAAGVSITGGSGSISSTSIQNSIEYVVNLTGVSNAQRLTITLTGVRDTAGDRTDTLAVPLAVLVADTNADKFTDAVDVSQTKSQSGKPLTNTNFREDVNVDGFIDAVDTALVKSKSGTRLP
jgi:hypothetical protein